MVDQEGECGVVGEGVYWWWCIKYIQEGGEGGAVTW